MVLALAAYVHASVATPQHEVEPTFAAGVLLVDLIGAWTIAPVRLF